MVTREGGSALSVVVVVVVETVTKQAATVPVSFF